MVHPTDTGTGPFELRERSARGIVIARNVAWWGMDLRLGPAIDSISLTYVNSSAARARMLRRGAVDIAEGLAPADARALGRDPLVDVEGARGVSRSVRGVSGEVPSLQAAWLTTIGG